jgi:uncharacterized membrane protein
MIRPTLALAILLSACVPAQERSCESVRTQADVGLIVGSGAIMIGTTAAVDPTSAVDSREKRHTRTALVLTAAGVALVSAMVTHDAGWGMRECRENTEKTDVR